MRPNKPINSGDHRTGTAGRVGKARYFSTGIPTAPAESNSPTPAIDDTARSPENRVAHKYTGRASVGPLFDADQAAVAIDVADSEWTDPLDDDETIDLTTITIDLRETLVEEPPVTYYQRHSSRVPGHQ